MLAPVALAQTSGFGKIIAAAGTVELAGKALKTGDVLSAGGLLTLSEGAKVKIYFPEAKWLMMSAGPSRVHIEPPSPKSKFEVLDGFSRWVRSKALPAGKTQGPYVVTKSSVMGARGTDFIAVANELLGESEIIVFDGEVNFTSRISKGDRRSVTSGHWGGVGGRFGQKIAPLIALPASVLDVFKQKLSVDTATSGAKESADFHGQKIPE